MREHFDFLSIFIILITITLFGIALYVKGFTHDLLLEAAVFLVSVKLIHGSYKNSIATQRLEAKLDQILGQRPNKTN